MASARVDGISPPNAIGELYQKNTDFSVHCNASHRGTVRGTSRDAADLPQSSPQNGAFQTQMPWIARR